MKLKFLILTAMIALSLTGVSQTQVILHFHNADAQEYSVSAAGKIYFDNENLYIEDGNVLPYAYPVSSISKMLFIAPVGIEDIETPDLKIYPNPANSFIKISSNFSENTYQIFSMEGRLLLAGSCHNDESINVSALSKGIYLIKVNGQTFKISKL